MDPFYEIRTEPIQTAIGKQLVNRQAIINVETNEIISVMSDNYEVVSNKEIAATLEGYLNETDTIYHQVSKSCNRTGSKFHARYILPKILIEVGTEETPDNIQLGIDLHNSYNGSSTWGFTIFGYRLICLNGLRVPETIHAYKSRHFTDSEEIAEELLLSIQTAIDIFQSDVRITFGKIQQIDFSKMKAATLFKALNLSSQYAAIFGRLYKEKQNDLKTMWDFYQLITWFTSHVVEARNVNLAKNISATAFEFLNSQPTN